MAPSGENHHAADNGGDFSALDDLHRRYHHRLVAVAYRILGDHAEAEDVVQRIFLRLPRVQFRGESSVWTYLYRAASNASVNALRTRRRRERLERELVDQARLVESLSPHTGDPEHQVLEGEILAGVARALLRVRPQHRRVLVMRVVWGLSNAEIALREGIPSATVGTWLRRGRKDLIREMGPLLSEFEGNEE